MKFGSTDHPEELNLELPKDDEATAKVLAQNKTGLQDIYVGCAKWNRQDLKGFYPRGTKDELVYYSTQFNSIELNATFYRIFPKNQSEKWAQKTPTDFKFFPKVPQSISHFQRLSNCTDIVYEFCDSIAGFKEKLGMPFLQMPDNFTPKHFDRLKYFISEWPKGVSWALELRHTDWYNDKSIATKLTSLLEANQISSIITDTAGRRDLLHMRLTSPTAFVRYVGANHSSDYDRLDEWVSRIREWNSLGLEHLYFFIHQNLENESPLLATHFIQQLNEALGTNVQGPISLMI
ncbi:MAG: DUF72 domain-containing protein [Reichenbachiella sp.]|uniref:DUF72 domain-containing protein n=1 Tax=Reichenbachiella sp. TaxID=2184521 RepID=UPI0032655E5D